MKTTKKWSKVLLAGMAAMLLSFGLVLAGCDDKSDDPPCCTASTWAFMGTDGPTSAEGLAEIAKLPTCCQEALTKVMALDDPETATEAELKAATGCCYDALVAAMGDD